MDTLKERRDGEDRRGERSALALFGNGKAEWLRWIVGLLLALAMGWTGARLQLERLDQREQSHFDELLRVMERSEKRLERIEDRMSQR